MPKIEITTKINASIDIVFNLSRSIDLHTLSAKKTKEVAIAGKTKGLISKGETVTWRAKHLGVTQTLTSKITEYNAPKYFVDVMVDGVFKSFTHEHVFIEDKEDATIMKDVFNYESPLGFLGVLADKLFLKRYMTNFISKRNEVIKSYAESDKYKLFI